MLLGDCRHPDAVTKVCGIVPRQRHKRRLFRSFFAGRPGCRTYKFRFSIGARIVLVLAHEAWWRWYRGCSRRFLTHPAVCGENGNRKDLYLFNVEHARTPLRHLVPEPGRNDGDLYFISHALVEDSTEDDVCVFVR